MNRSICPKELDNSFETYPDPQRQVEREKDFYSFRFFMNQVNQILMWRFGVTAHDLTDYLWRDAYDDGLSPEEAVEDFLDDNAADFEFR